ARRAARLEEVRRDAIPLFGGGERHQLLRVVVASAAEGEICGQDLVREVRPEIDPARLGGLGLGVELAPRSGVDERIAERPRRGGTDAPRRVPLLRGGK